MGFTIKESFLQTFNAVRPEDWVDSEPGRIARLRLHGPLGTLDLIIVYLASGADAATKAARRHSMSLLASAIADKNRVLSLVMGDFNFVEGRADRWSIEDGSWTGHRDHVEASFFKIGYARLTVSLN